MTIYELADILDRDIEVRRFSNQGSRWTAHIEDCEVKDGDFFLLGTYGNGNSPAWAIVNYVQQIKGKKLIRSAMTEERMVINVPDTLTA